MEDSSLMVIVTDVVIDVFFISCSHYFRKFTEERGLFESCANKLETGPKGTRDALSVSLVNSGCFTNLQLEPGRNH